jgi:hypothetical protein
MAVTAILERFEGLGLRTLLLAIPVLVMQFFQKNKIKLEVGSNGIRQFSMESQ